MKTSLLALLALLSVAGTGDSLSKSILILSGASSLEELDETEMERYSDLHEHPLDLNSASASRLLSCGLFSTFQVNSLVNYREEYGDILSFSELGLISGFSDEVAGALKEFVTLRSTNSPGQVGKSLKLRGSATVKASVRSDSGSAPSPAFGFKTELELGERAELHWASRTTYSDGTFRPGTFSAAYYGRRRLGTVVAGHFSARFGQGLTQWSGFSLSSLKSSSAFVKNGTGITATSSFSPENLGAGAEFLFGRWALSAACSFDSGPRPIVNVSHSSLRCTAGITATYEKAGADFKLSLPDLCLFSEFSQRYAGGAAGLAGLLWIPRYGTRAALLCKYFDPRFKKEYSIAAACFENAFLTASAEAGWHFSKSAARYKGELYLHREFKAGSVTFEPSLRASGRYQPADGSPFRTELRAEASASASGWMLSGRYDILWGESRSWLWYLEPGYEGPDIRGFLRFTLFCVPVWADRIYVYERDVPGNFNVPAYLGKGFSLSAYSGITLQSGEKRHTLRHRLDLRASLTAYPWNEEPKAQRAELKFQYTAKF